MMRASFAPLPATIAAASTTFLDVGWPAANVLDPLRPHIRAYSASLGPQRLTLDFGAAVQPQVVFIGHTNFTTMTIQQKNTDTSWGSPSYTQAITLARSGTGRYHYGLQPAIAFPANLFQTQRFLSLSVPAQATTDGATVFKIGVVYPGLVVAPPRDVRHGRKPEKLHPRLDSKTPDGRTVDRVLLDDPIRRIRATRQSANGAEMSAWEEFDRQWDEAPGQAALVCWRDTAPQECYVMRREDDSEWTDTVLWSEGDMECLEVTSG